MTINYIETMKQALPELEQALLEMHHAHTNPHYFTNGKEGAIRQFILWHQRATESITSLRAAIDAAEKQEPAIRVIRNLSGQIHMTDAKGSCFDISKFIGQDFYTNPAPTQSDSEQAKIGCIGHDGDCCKGREQVYLDAARYRKERDELLEAMEGETDAVQFLMDWCVKNINKWDFPQYDNLCYWIEKRKAAISKVGSGGTADVPETDFGDMAQAVDSSGSPHADGAEVKS